MTPTLHRFRARIRARTHRTAWLITAILISPVVGASPPVSAQASAPAEDDLERMDERIRWYADRILVTTLLGGHHVGLEETDRGLFNVYFGPLWLGHFFEDKRLILDSPDPRGTGRRRSGGRNKGRRTVKKVR